MAMPSSWHDVKSRPTSFVRKKLVPTKRSSASEMPCSSISVISADEKSQVRARTIFHRHRLKALKANVQSFVATCSQSASVKEAPANLQSLNVQRVNAALSNMLLEKSQPSKAMSTKSAPVKSQLRNWQFEKRPLETSSSSKLISAAWSPQNSTASSVPRLGSQRVLRGNSSREAAR